MASNARRSFRLHSQGQVREITVAKSNRDSPFVTVTNTITQDRPAIDVEAESQSMDIKSFVEIFAAAWGRILPENIRNVPDGASAFRDGYMADVLYCKCREWCKKLSDIPENTQKVYAETVEHILEDLHKESNFSGMAIALIGFSKFVAEAAIEFQQVVTDANQSKAEQRRTEKSTQTGNISKVTEEPNRSPGRADMDLSNVEASESNNPSPHGTATIFVNADDRKPKALNYSSDRKMNDCLVNLPTEAEIMLSPTNFVVESNAKRFGGLQLDEVTTREPYHDTATEPDTTFVEADCLEPVPLRQQTRSKSVHFDPSPSSLMSSVTLSPAELNDSHLIATQRPRNFTETVRQWWSTLPALPRSRRNSSVSGSRRGSVIEPRSRKSTVNTRSRKNTLVPRSRRSSVVTDDLPKLSSKASKSSNGSKAGTSRSRKSTMSTMSITPSTGNNSEIGASGGRSRKESIVVTQRPRTSTGQSD